MELNGVHIEDTFAEAFPMSGARLIITAKTPGWAMTAAQTMTGFATSVIACGCEAGIERELTPSETPDGRPGVAVLLFSFSEDMVKQQLINRVGQCVLTCPTTACYAGSKGETAVPLGDGLRYFGDGFQISKQLASRRFWRLPVMDGEFIIEDKVGVAPGIGGGNFLIMATDGDAALKAAEAAIVAMRKVPDVIMPFPGGVVRSGSKVGSKYKALPASTNDAYCPTIRGQTKTALPAEVEAVLEIVIDGFTEAAIDAATVAGIEAACAGGRKAGVVGITAGNYGGKLGPFHFHLRKLLQEGRA